MRRLVGLRRDIKGMLMYYIYVGLACFVVGVVLDHLYARSVINHLETMLKESRSHLDEVLKKIKL